MSVALHHIDLGGAGNPPLVLLHGLLGSSRNWLTTGRDLAGRWHVLALDARNHGKSPARSGDELRCVGRRRRRLDAGARPGPGPRSWGHSMGGKTAMRLACRQPALVEGLVVVDIAPRNYSWAAHRAEFAAMNELDLGSLASRTEAELRFEGRVPNLGMRKFLTTNLERDEAGHWRWIIDLPALTGGPARAGTGQSGAGRSLRWAGSLHRGRPVGLCPAGGSRADSRPFPAGGDRDDRRGRPQPAHGNPRAVRRTAAQVSTTIGTLSRMNGVPAALGRGQPLPLHPPAIHGHAAQPFVAGHGDPDADEAPAEVQAEQPGVGHPDQPHALRRRTAPESAHRRSRAAN
ncbi:MAG: alpha/beta fold hydrolase [Lacunisphaera sp.]